MVAHKEFPDPIKVGRPQSIMTIKPSEKGLVNYVPFLIYVAKIGGWIGLVVGASLISYLEFIYFTIQLIWTALKRGQVEHAPPN